MSFFKNLLHNCEETSFNIIKSEVTPLPFSAWLKMKTHIAFCKCCENFGKQANVIDKAMHHHVNATDESEKASQELKDRIKQKLKQNDFFCKE
ncbi:hypothetical protein J3D55_004479 [Chryseobacterium ginsenosidimutans]|uniref:hypothetical protein n=1 Tax=Chryseobacterium ginsenosidimutans TaxID=687846 RepID=UPI00216A25D9|nr:hypothetical protein [Chryseobacterium ginsenosidimutans]MCS3871563.1 hypothetical protein [Chryseobacterium ginsenosidimutans]